MRLNMRWISLGSAALVFATLVALAACSDSQAARSSPEPGDTSLAGNYVLVTELRPVSRDQYVAYKRSVYELCAVILGNHQRVAKPFPAVSTEFFGTRTTYAGDGRRTVVRERVGKLDFVAGQAESNCEMRWSTLTNVTLTSDGRQQTAQRDENGKMHLAALPGIRAITAPYAFAKVLEPLSLSVGKPVDPALFLLDKQL